MSSTPNLENSAVHYVSHSGLQRIDFSDAIFTDYQLVHPFNEEESTTFFINMMHAYPVLAERARAR